jgi:hypothetical protein
MDYGIDQFIKDFEALGYRPMVQKGNDNQIYAIFNGFEVPLGKFAGRIIDLGILVLSDYPRIVHSSIHVKANPQLYEKKDTVPGVRNIIDSGLGSDWRYWSYAFKATAEDTALNLMSQINGIFKRA